MHTQGGMAYIHEHPQPVNTERGLLPQVYDTSLDPNQLELPDLPPPYLPVLPCIPCTPVFQSSGIPFYLFLTSGIVCAASYVTSIAGTLYNNVGGFRKPIRICNVIKAIQI